MIREADETVGEQFQLRLLQDARNKTLEVILVASRQMTPGMSEDEARLLVADIQTRLGAPKSWHPPQIRFGENTTLPFGKKGIEGVRLKENDIFFIDIGPIFEGHEGDVGRAFSIGQDSDMIRCCRDVEIIWHEVRNKWAEKGKTGRELYQFAKIRALMRGWDLCLEKANGHRIADFPHGARMKNSVEELETVPSENRWILEIQIRHSEKPFGAFYEDLLV